MKTILVPVDLSSATTRVCDAAATLAKLIGARLVLLHVVQLAPVMTNDYYSLGAVQMADLTNVAEKASAKRLHALAQKYAKRGQVVKTLLETGSPVTTIRDRAAKIRADYIVIGSHGHTAFYDLLVGGTTHGVLRKARCPVLVVPTGSARGGD